MLIDASCVPSRSFIARASPRGRGAWRSVSNFRKAGRLPPFWPRVSLKLYNIRKNMFLFANFTRLQRCLIQVLGLLRGPNTGTDGHRFPSLGPTPAGKSLATPLAVGTWHLIHFEDINSWLKSKYESWYWWIGLKQNISKYDTIYVYFLLTLSIISSQGPSV